VLEPDFFWARVILSSYTLFYLGFMFTRVFQALTVCVLGVALLTACTQEHLADLAKPIISSVQPDVAVVGSQVLVTGSNFGNQSGQMRVIVGGEVVFDASVVVPGQSIKFVMPAMNTGSYGVRVMLADRESNMASIKVVTK
jgi:IPT/TIG domain